MGKAAAGLGLLVLLGTAIAGGAFNSIGWFLMGLVVIVLMGICYLAGRLDQASDEDAALRESRRDRANDWRP